MSIARRVGVLLAVAVIALLLPPLASAEEDTSVTWGIAPVADEDGDRVSVRAELDPGDEYTDEVVVTNYSSRATMFQIEASDGVVTPAGDFDILSSDQSPTGSGRWIEIDDEVHIGPSESVTIPFTVRVPDDARPGDHPAGITASLANPGDAGVSFDARVGVRLHLRVSGELEPRLELTELRSEYQGTWNPFARGTLVVSWTVTNVGNVRLGSYQELDVRGPWGLGTEINDRLIGDQREILPGQSVSGTYEVEAWPVFQIATTVTATPKVVGEDQFTVGLSATSDETKAVAIPRAQILVAVIFVLLAMIAVRWFRENRRYRTGLERELADARTEKTPVTTSVD